MQGLHIINDKEKYIEKVNQKSGELALLAKGDGTEIMTMEIKSNKLFSVDPGDTDEVMEFFYLLKGSVVYQEDEKDTILYQGDYFYVQHLKEPVTFKTLKETGLLYVSSKPVFHFLSNDIKELYEIVKKVEKKDIYTHDHGKRVEEYSFKIAERLNLPRERMELLCYSALFHDIGKVNVPDKILNKPDRLTENEMNKIKKHPSDGYEMVKGTFLESIGKIIEQHHERIDGSGYPNGLKGNEIFLEAKIIGVVDSYDAMISDRPYRKGLGSRVAVEELQRLSNRHYDEKIVKVFTEILKEEGKI